MKITGSDNKNILNVPNFISFYRLLSFPLVLYFAIAGFEKLFIIFLAINLVSDAVDGLIARMFNLQTEFGARLDSIADIGSYILAVVGIFVFKADDFTPHLTSFIIFLSLFGLVIIVSFIKFRRAPSLHLYSWKIGGYIQGTFLFVLFVFKFYTFFYYLMIAWGILSFIEHITIQMILPKMKSNAKGLYWILKNKKVQLLKTD